ncbi:MAG: hypothetical protein OXM56_11090 [Gammaproteobacteria bacterium]|nr:hypothetical protein [Gammaproteobacteria bacterium]
MTAALENCTHAITGDQEIVFGYGNWKVVGKPEIGQRGTVYGVQAENRRGTITFCGQELCLIGTPNPESHAPMDFEQTFFDFSSGGWTENIEENAVTLANPIVALTLLKDGDRPEYAVAYVFGDASDLVVAIEAAVREHGSSAQMRLIMEGGPGWHGRPRTWAYFVSLDGFLSARAAAEAMGSTVFRLAK